MYIYTIWLERMTYMSSFRESMMVAFAFVGVVVGAGFATGQEIFQFFTIHGSGSIPGLIITGAMITVGGIFVLNTGYRLRAYNHSQAIRYYLHPTIAQFIDIVLTLFLLSLAIIMTAGGASTIHESFKLPYWISSLLLVLLILATLFLKFERLITVLGMVTPFLIIVVTIIAVYYFITGHLDFSIVDSDNNKLQTHSPGWWFDGLNYASLQIAAAFSFLSVMGGRLQYKSSTLWGGLCGGLIVTFLILMINLGLLTKYTEIKGVALPSLLLAQHISPILGTIMSVIMVLVIYNTVVGLMYAFAARFSEPFTTKYYVMIIIMAIATYICTFIGFISLIGKVFPIMGLFGFILLIPIIFKGFKRLKTLKS